MTLTPDQFEAQAAAFLAWRRRARAAAVAGSVALFGLVLLAGFTIREAGERAAEQRTIDETITRIIDRDPCTQKPLNPEACKAFLRKLADPGVFPQVLSCYIAGDAGLDSPACDRLLGRLGGGDGQPPGNPGQPPGGTAPPGSTPPNSSPPRGVPPPFDSSRPRPPRAPGQPNIDVPLPDVGLPSMPPVCVEGRGCIRVNP